VRVLSTHACALESCWATACCVYPLQHCFFLVYLIVHPVRCMSVVAQCVTCSPPTSTTLPALCVLQCHKSNMQLLHMLLDAAGRFLLVLSIAQC
jgi:hypothetical protein